MARHRARRRTRRTPTPRRSGRRPVGDTLVALGAALVFVAVPAVLVRLVGSPVPHRWALGSVLSWRGLLDLLTLLAWIAWFACCWPLARKVVSRVRSRETTAVPGAGWSDRLATRIAAGILAVAPLSGATAAGALTPPAAIASASPPAAAVGASAAPAPVAPPSLSGMPLPNSAAPTATAGTPTVAAPLQYTVADGDSLWSIAQSLYGDGGEWTVLAKANLGRTMPDGTQFSDPSLIMPGWVLTVPATPDTGPPPETPAAAPALPATSAAVPSIAPGDPPAPPASAAPPAPVGSLGITRLRPRPPVTHRPQAMGARGSTLPELAALGLGAVVAAALARRARRARLARSLERREGEPVEPQSDLAEGSAALLMPFEGTPALEWLERANRHLAMVLMEEGRPVPPVRCLRVGPDGVSVLLADSVSWAPESWRLEAGGWHLPAPVGDVLDALAVAETPPLVPGLVPVGDNERGSWFAALGPGQVLPVVGADGEDLVRAMVAGLESWSWTDELIVTGDPAAAEQRDTQPRAPTRPELVGAETLVFVGDPETLSPDARSRWATVTTAARPASDLLVAVDGDAASLHPLGIVVRPHRLTETRRRALEEITSAPAGGEEEPTVVPADTSNPPAVPLSAVATMPATLRLREPPSACPAASPTGAGPLEPGMIEVRLLTPEPRIEGLASALPAKRARRATELVAYLALHHPDPVTSDRLRTRVLGSPDADAASKTLFNTAGAARRALGSDPAGQPHLPPATKTGHYRLGSEVSCDVHRVLELARLGEETGEPGRAMGLLRAALELVEGEPLARVYSGYTWWQAEGHERRVAGALVDAACRLARLAVAEGHLELARWGVEHARLVEPYSEALCRTAMRVAAAAGDLDLLRWEWLECRRRVDELDPGSVPSESTEELYEELRRRLPPSSVGRPD